jgi:hypothetical protein
MSHTDEKLDALLEAIGCLITEQKATRGRIDRLLAERENDLANAREDHEQQGAMLLDHEGRLERHEERLDELADMVSPLGGAGHG